jgi:hypothetical protein
MCFCKIIVGTQVGVSRVSAHLGWAYPGFAVQPACSASADVPLAKARHVIECSDKEWGRSPCLQYKKRELKFIWQRYSCREGKELGPCC